MTSPEDRLLKKIIKESGLPLKIFAEATELGSKNALNWWVGENKINIKDKQIDKFENYFGISLSNVTSETIKLLRKRMYGDFNALPDRYNAVAKSKARSSYYIIRYLQLLYGNSFVDKLLSSMSIHPRFFEDLNREINLVFLNDLLKKCEELGFKDVDFKRIAQSMFLSIEQSELEKILCLCKSYEDLYLQFSKIISEFDTNFIYDFFVTENGADLVTRLSPDLKDMITSNKIDINYVLSYRPILFSQLPALSKMRTLNVNIKTCISRGDQFSRFQVRFPVDKVNVINF